MKLFCFHSDNLRHIELGIEAKRWAVHEGERSRKARITKARRNFGPGACGLFYCSADQTFRVPFLVKSKADPNTVIRDIWPGEWHLPFYIEPLAGINKRVPKRLAEHVWGWGSLFERYLGANCVFVPIKGFDDQVWQAIRRQFMDGSTAPARDVSAHVGGLT